MNGINQPVLRDFIPEDATEIVKWITSEREFYYWSADRYGHYPIKPEEIVDNYRACAEKTFFKPMMMESDGVSVGHLILRTPVPGNDRIIRLGFIIINPAFRGCGYGKAIVGLGTRLAADTLGAAEVNLGVFENNAEAIRCYLKSGFAFDEDDKDEITEFSFKDEIWNYKRMTFKG